MKFILDTTAYDTVKNLKITFVSVSVTGQQMMVNFRNGDT
jgi:hypothetical protein